MPKIILFFLLLSTSTLFAQNEPQNTLFAINYANFNPAMYGVQYAYNANVIYRNQWSEVYGAPVTLNANYAQRISKLNGAVGLSYQYDHIGFSTTNTALATYAYHIQTEKILWSIGVSAGIKTYAINSDLFVASNMNDPYLFPKYKPAFQANAGIAMHTEKLNVGFSVTQLNSPRIRMKSTDYKFNFDPTLHLHADYTLAFGEKWKVIPAIHVFTDLVKYGSTTSIRAVFADKIWFGVNSWNLFSTNDYKTFGPMLGYDFKEKYRIGYSLEFSDYKPNGNQNLTHEIVLSFMLK